MSKDLKLLKYLQLARSQGDLSENADYDAAREKQAHLESRIKEIDYMLQNAEVISEEQMDLKSSKTRYYCNNLRFIRKRC